MEKEIDKWKIKLLAANASLGSLCQKDTRRYQWH